MKLLDLRSDTLTLPSSGMRQYMASAAVGDAFYDEDPSVNALEIKVAELFGHESALFVPTGTMSNQIALQLHCNRGEGVLCVPDLHIVRAESGGMAALAGVQPVALRTRSDGFSPDLKSIEQTFVGRDSIVAPPTTLLVLENTHLFSGGRIHHWEHLKELSQCAQQMKIAIHLDGARLWHAHVESGIPLRQYGQLFTTLSVCFSKGLGAPVGSCLVGSEQLIKKAKILRKRLGGSMRQCGILAAAALYALENHLKTLVIDHRNAKKLAHWLQKEFPDSEVLTPETNIVLLKAQFGAEQLIPIIKNRYNLVLSALNSKTLRAVCHRDVSEEDIDQLTGYAGVSL